MRKKVKIILPVAAVVVLAGAAFWGLNGVDAAGRGMGGSELAQKIAERFNLDKKEVDKFFLEERENQRVHMRVRMEDRLAELVAEKKLTEDQKNSLLKLIEKHQKELGRSLDKSFEQRQEELKAHRDELEKWASDNGIALSDLRIFGPGFPGKGRGRHLDN